jgi:putative endonuclease
MDYFVYLLISLNNKKPISYVGYTNNLSERIKLHNTNKGAKFTKGRMWKLIFFKRYDSKKVAMVEEYKLKKNRLLRAKIKNDYLNK